MRKLVALALLVVACWLVTQGWVFWPVVIILGVLLDD